MNLQESYNKIDELNKDMIKTRNSFNRWKIFGIIYVISHIITLIYTIFIK